MNTAADHTPGLAHRAQRGGNERAYGGKQNRGIQQRGWRLVGAARPRHAKRVREVLRRHVAGRGERVHVAALPGANLGDDVSRRAKSVNPHPASRISEPAAFSDRQPMRPAQSSGASATGSAAASSGNA